MLAAILHLFGFMEILDRIEKLLSNRNFSDAGKALYGRLDERFKLAAREEFWPWAMATFQPRDPAGYKALFARQQERHEWRNSGGAFNALSESYMNVALGKVFRAETDPENRFRIFGEVARMDDAEFAAWLDAVTDDGFEQYFEHLRWLVVHAWAPEVNRLRAYADRALRSATLAAGVFLAFFVLAETSGWDAIYALLAIFVVVAIAVTWWQWPTLVVVLSASKQTRKALEPVAAGFATTILLVVVGMFVPTHLAPWKMQVASLAAVAGLGGVAYWGFLKGMKSSIVTPKTVGFALTSVIVVTVLWAFNVQQNGAIGNAVSPVYEWAKDLVTEPFASSASAAEAGDPPARLHSVQTTCPASMEWEGVMLKVPARPDCWSDTITIPTTATNYSVSAEGECWEAFLLNPTGDVTVAGERGIVWTCMDPPVRTRGILKVRSQVVPRIIEVSYR